MCTKIYLEGRMNQPDCRGTLIYDGKSLRRAEKGRYCRDIIATEIICPYLDCYGATYFIHRQRPPRMGDPHQNGHLESCPLLTFSRVSPYTPPKSKPVCVARSFSLLRCIVVSCRILSMLKATSRNLEIISFSTQL